MGTVKNAGSVPHTVLGPANGGLDALTHRAAAARASVPPGSTTYYFADLDELLATTHRQISVLAYELYGAALRRPALRAANTAWDNMLGEVFESQVDPITAKALTAMFDGLFYQTLVAPRKPRRIDVERVLRRLLT